MENNSTRAVLVFFFSLFLFLGVFSNRVYASHMMGADLTYQCLGGLDYKITLRFYRDCAGASAPTSVPINLAGCGLYNFNVTANQVGPAVEVSSLCPAQINNSTCHGGSLPGVQQYTYSANVTLPGTCANWVFSWSSCCRNYGINTGPGGNSIFVYATLNNVIAPCNTSPVFSSYPVPYFCQGQNANYNHGAFDVDGDSLTYQMVMPLQTSTTTNVTFFAPYSPTYPIATAPANSFGFNNLTGQMNFTPALVQQGVVAVRVFEWRNGVVIGSVTRDIQLVTINCVNNSNVQISPIQNLQGATTAAGNYNIRVCAGNTASFNITASDPNAATILSMVANLPPNMTGATFTTTGNNPKVGTFTWPTNASNIGFNNFTLTVTDNNCPIPSTQVIGFTINVFGVDISAGNFAICPGTAQSIQLNASVGGSSVGCTGPNCYSWSPATGLSATNIPNPTATVSQPITYTVTFNDGTCIATDQVSITSVGSVSATPPTASICNGGTVQLNATNTFPNQGGCGTSNAPCVGGISLKTVGTTTTVNNTNLSSVTPYQGWWHDGRIQMLIRASELTAAGITPGLLRSVAFQVASKYSSIGYQGFTIQVGCTSQTALTSFITSGLTQVYTGTVSPVVGWNTYNFTTPYQWDGTSNIVVQVCHNNSSFTNGDPVYYNTTSYNSVYYGYQDNGVGCSLAGGASNGAPISTLRPNMRFNFCAVAPPVVYTWTSISGSPVSTLSSTTIGNPVASPTQTTSYVIGASNGSCTVYDTVTISMSNSSVLNDIPDQLSCPNAAVTLTATGTNINAANVTWSGGLTGPSITVNPAVTTIYTYSVNTPCGNLSQSTTINVGDNIPPTLVNCPANISVNNTPNVCGATVSWVAPTANDNCSATVTQTLGPPSGSVFPVGTTTVTYTATDVGGNTATCSFTVTVTDTQIPSITCSGNVTVNTAPNTCQAIVNLINPVTSDNCAVLSVTNNAPAVYPLGVTTVTWTVTDNHGNTNTCTQTVTVVDAQIPAIACPSNVTVNADPGVCNFVGPNLGNPVTSDNCGVLNVLNNAPANLTYPVGASTVTWTVNDVNGNSNTCAQTVTVIDAEAPVIQCPNTILVNSDAGVCQATIPNLGATVTTDNCLVASMTNNAPAGLIFPVGFTIVTWTVTDASGNTATCSQVVGVEDHENPVIANCPANISMNNDAGVCGATVTWAAPTISDNCPNASIVQTAGLASGSVFPIGTSTITYIATDAHNNKDTCTFSITIIDNENPVIVNCPANISVNNTSGACEATVTWAMPTVTDNCPNATLVQAPGLGNGAVFPLGTTTVTYNATDASGNTATCSFTVTVIDNENPVIVNCPANISVNNDLGVCGAVVTWAAPTVSDNCPNATITQTAGLASGSVFPLGTTTITYNATDAVGNVAAACSFTVTVTDNESPVITNCPTNFVLNNDAGICGAVVSWATPTVSDNCPNATITQTAGLTSGSVFPLGVSTVTYTANDANGNSATCTFTITVTDNELPVIANCPANISVNNDLGVCGATITWTNPTVSDNCPNATITQTAGLANGSIFPLGTTTVTYIANDANGNSATCTFTVTVTDNELPVIAACPANITVAADPAICGAIINWNVATVSDNCPNATITQTAGLANGATFPIGTTTITYIANDANGNSATCSFTVSVTDNENPVIVNCPANISVNNDLGVCGATVTWVAPTTTDNCSATIAQTTGLASSSVFPLGTTTITYVATDLAGNTATCTFDINVTDTELPVIVACPANISVNNDLGVCGATVTWSNPTVSDNCPNATITQTAGLANGSVFPLGATTITYTANDANGNSVTCTFTVTVTDTELPVIANCPANISVNNDAGVCGATINWTNPTVSDNCPNATITQTTGLANGSVFPLGTSTISYTANDANGNSATCTFTVTVTDNELPVIANCPANISVSAVAGVCGAVVNWTVPTVSDNCPNATIAQTAGLNSGATFPIGTSTITYTANDANGNSATCTFTVTVTDLVNPIISGCPANISVSNDNNVCGAVVSWTQPIASDNCSATMVQTGLTSGSLFPIGTSTVTYTATDLAGNTATCSFTVTVNDTQFPSITNCVSNITIGNTTGNCSGVAIWTTPTITDNCPGLILSNTANSGATFPVGLTYVTYTATDASGNVSTCTFSVTVNDTENPTITNCPSDISVNANTNCQAIVNWTAPTMTDNCSGLITSSNLNSGAIFPLGTTAVTYTATDAAGNVSTCTFNVIVTDNTPPVIANCPANISVNNDAGVCGATINWTPLTVTDNCPNPTLTATSVLSNGSVFPIGTTNVVYVANDANGNSATCSFTVTVTDNELPVIVNCPANINVPVDAGTCGAVVNWTAPSVTDNCPNATITRTGPASGSIFPIGTTTITYTANDIHGNSATCSFTITVTAPPALNINASVVQQVSCFGVKDGSATVVANGGSGSYAYTWSTTPPQYTATATGLGAGTYTVTVKDALSPACVTPKIAQVTITQPTQLAATLQKVNPLCNGDKNGSVTVSASGGTNPYSYSWNTTPTQIGTTATGLGAGTYTIVVTDGKGCTISKTATLTEPNVLASTITPKDVKCFGLNTGSATAATTGGTTPYNYVWTNSVSNTNSASDYPAGNYNVTITDAHGCNITKNFTISQPAQALNVTIVGTDASCYLKKDGSALATVTGGTSPYNVIWNTSPQQTGLSAINLKAGNVTATATDANGCKQNATIQISQPTRIDVDVLYMNEAYCNLENGSVLVGATGGKAPYTYTWNSTPPQYGPNLINAGEATYDVKVYDSKGCHDSTTVVVPNEPPAIPNFISEPTNANPILLSQANIHFENQSVGAAAYSWDFGDANSDIRKNPNHTFENTGSYTVTLTAFNSYGNACPTSTSMTFNIIPDGAVFIATGFSPNGDGINDVVGIVGEGIISSNWTIFDRWGKIVFYSTNYTDTWDGLKDGKAVPEGSYTYKLTVTLNNGYVLNRAGSITVLR